MSASRVFLILLVLFASMAPILVFKAIATSSEDAASSAIAKAEEVMVLAYDAVLQAERSGANVSSLLIQLNEAGELLAQAHISYRLVDVDGAARSANLCIDIGEAVKVKAYKLRDLAVEDGRQRFWSTIVGSIIGMGAVVCGSFLGWHVFKRRYFQRVLRMKPEVVSDES